MIQKDLDLVPETENSFPSQSTVSRIPKVRCKGVHALTTGGGLYVFQIVGNYVAADFQVAHNRVAR